MLSSLTDGCPWAMGCKEGPHILCHACRRPLLPKDVMSPAYEEGVSCHHCVDETSESDKDPVPRASKTNEVLARARGEQHIIGLD